MPRPLSRTWVRDYSAHDREATFSVANIFHDYHKFEINTSNLNECIILHVYIIGFLHFLQTCDLFDALERHRPAETD